jgi:tetratricopeptide (TPR) repeat protein
MHRNTPRRLLAATLVLGMGWVAAEAGEASAQTQDGAAGSRYRILVPALEVQGANARTGEAVSRDIRSMIDRMDTHSAVPAREMQQAVRRYRVSELTEITARQLAQQIDAQLVMWGTVSPGAQGLLANVTFTDTGTGDQLVLESVEGANPRALAQALFAGFQQQIEGLRMGVFCNDYLASSQYDRALELCDRALEVVPNSTSALFGRAAALMQLERDEEALEAFQRVLRIDPLYENALMGLGFVAGRMGQNDVALDAYTRYLELNPGDPAVRMRVAGESARAGDVVTAFRILEPGISENLADEDFQKYLLQVAAGAGQRAREDNNTAAMQEYFGAAIAAYNRLVTIPEAEIDEGVLRSVIAAHTVLGNHDEAQRVTQEAVARFPESAAMHAMAAQTYTEAGRHAEAVRSWTRVIEIEPAYESAHLRRALAHMAAGNRQAAEQDLRAAATNGDRENVGRVLAGMASEAAQRQSNFTEAERLATLALNYVGGGLRSDVVFIQGFSVFKQAETIARANSQGACAPAQRALPLFQRSISILQGNQHASTPQVRAAAQQYIENQQAIIQSACRG